MEWNRAKVNLIDTPGFANFFADARAALRVSEAALVVVDAVAGVEVQTEKAWQAAEELGLPRIVCVNRLDRDRASLQRTLESLRATLGRAIVPIQLPIGEEKQFAGVVDLVTMRALTSGADGSSEVSEGPVPGAMEAEAAAAREALVEMVAEADEQLMEHFFEAGTLTQDELVAGLKTATAKGAICPLVCASGLQNVGAHPLLDALVAYAPSPADRPFAAVADGQATTRPADEQAPYAAFVWKTVADQFAGRITLFRVYQGTLKSDSTVTNATRAPRNGSAT